MSQNDGRAKAIMAVRDTLICIEKEDASYLQKAETLVRAYEAAKVADQPAIGNWPSCGDAAASSVTGRFTVVEPIADQPVDCAESVAIALFDHACKTGPTPPDGTSWQSIPQDCRDSWHKIAEVAISAIPKRESSPLSEEDHVELVKLMADRMEATARAIGPGTYHIIGEKTTLAERALEAVKEMCDIQRRGSDDK